MQERPTEAQVAELDRLLKESQLRSARLRRATTLTTFGFVAVLLGAVAGLYVKARSMYTVDAFRATLPAQVEQLRPEVEATVRRVVDTAAPHYARLGQERLDRALPKLGEAVGAEIDGMSAALAQRAQRKVADALVAVEQKQVDRLRALYPDLDAQEFARLRKKWASDVQADTELVLADFHERAMTDLTVLGRTIESFGPSRFDDMPRDDLVRWYAHLWLSLVDHEILAGVEEGGRDG